MSSIAVQLDQAKRDAAKSFNRMVVDGQRWCGIVYLAATRSGLMLSLFFFLLSSFSWQALFGAFQTNSWFWPYQASQTQSVFNRTEYIVFQSKIAQVSRCHCNRL